MRNRLNLPAPPSPPMPQQSGNDALALSRRDALPHRARVEEMLRWQNVQVPAQAATGTEQGFSERGSEVIQPISQLSTEEQLGLMLSRKVGIDKESGIYVSRSAGRTKRGDHHYTLVVPSCNMWITDSGHVLHESEYFYTRATDDSEAIDKFNKRIERWNRRVSQHAAKGD